MKNWIMILCLVSFFNSKAQPYKYLVMEGGGIRGVTYAGAIKVLEEKKVIDGLEATAGTSVGALVAGLVAVGYSAEELKTILDELKLQKFNDGKWMFIGGIHRTKRNFGWYRGEAIEKWIGKLIAEKTGNENLTLLQLHQLAQNDKQYKDLYAVATNLTMQRKEVLFYGAYPLMQVKTAIRASISIPLYYGAVFLDSSGNAYKKQNSAHTRQILIDGGFVANYPLNIFDSTSVNRNTLGLKLERPEQIGYDLEGLAPYKITSIGSYIAALYNITIEQLNKPVSIEAERSRTIYISTGHISPRVRKISKAQKELMYNNGRLAAEKFFGNK